MELNVELFNAIGKGNRKLVIEIVQKAADSGQDVIGLLMDTMIPAMREVGDKFSRNEIFVPEMLIAARAMQSGLTIIEPILVKAGHKPIAKVAIGTVKGDLHDIGKNLVAMMLKGAGFEVMDLGVDCDTEKFAKAAAEGASAICLSALLTTTMPYMKNVVDHFGKTNSKVKVIIGGAPVTQLYADQIGANGYSGSASEAVRTVTKCLGLS